MTDQHPFEDNPLSLELKSLRASVARFQDEAHASAVKLQRHSLDNVRFHERAVHLERENDLLRAELSVLRANPHANVSSEAQTQVQELTLSLRRLSHKLSLTEEVLFAKTTELIHAHAESITAKANADNAYELGARVRGREEAGKVRERELERKVMQLEDDLRMADVVMKEYAALVREMEARSSSSQSGHGHSNGDAKPDAQRLLADTLVESEPSRERLVQSRTEAEKLHLQLRDVTAKLEKTTAQLEAEMSSNQAVRAEIGRTRTELEKLQLEDGTAAKMVSRYMQFSQASTNNLLSTLSTLKARHEGTLSTLTSQNFALSTQLRSSEVQNERLRSALDELGGEILKESYGRRREVALRIKMGGREDRIVEGLRRWVRRGDEALTRLRTLKDASTNHYTTEFDALLGMAQDARILLEGLEEGAFDEGTALSLSSSRARAFLINNGLDGLLDELREENERRVMLEKNIASLRLDKALANGTGLARKDGQEPDDDEPPKVPEKLYPPISLPPTKSPVIHQDAPRVDRPSNGSADHSLSQEQDEENSDSSLALVVPKAKALSVESPDQSDVHSDPPSSTLPPQSDLASSPKVDLDAIPLSDNVDNSQNLTDPATVDTLTSPSPITITKVDEQVAHENSVVEDAPSSSTPTLPSVEDDPDDPSTPTVLETTVQPPPSEDPPSQTQQPISFPSALIIVTPERNPSPHPLLADLARVSKRYDDLQRAFRDCHLALEGLKVSLTSSEVHTSTPIPVDILEAALGRLDDYTEDARVELEIRVGDEALLAKGYEALLCVPGAMAASIPVRDGEEDGSKSDEPTPIRSEVEKQIEEFVLGDDRVVRKARETFTRKLEDVQHDIASLKRAIYDPDSLMIPLSASSSSSSPHFQNLTPSASTSTLNLAAASKQDSANGGGGWTSWIRGSPSRPSSPALPAMGPAPTFGNIMTSPRLRHSPSTGNFHNQSHTQTQNQGSGSRRSSFFNLGAGAASTDVQTKDPLAQLGLKISMPNFGMSSHHGVHSTSPLFGGGGGGYGYGGVNSILSPTSPLAPLGAAGPTSSTAGRTRTVSSSMYMLGLGAVGSSGRISRSTSSSGVSVGGSGIGSPLGMSRQASSSSSHAEDYERDRGNVEGGGGKEENGEGGDEEKDGVEEEEEEDTDIE